MLAFTSDTRNININSPSFLNIVVLRDLLWFKKKNHLFFNVVQCSWTMSELQGTHIFLVVIKQGKFSLHQHKLPLQKLWVLFTFLPQHPFIEPWIQFKISTQSPVLQYTQVLLKNEYVFMTWPNVLQRETIFTSWLFRYAKNRFSLHSSAFVWGNALIIFVLHRQIYILQ